MTKKLVGKKAPNFKAECTSEKTYSRDDFNGKNLVLYFYPKDSTPGCTTEGQNFRDLYEEFQANNTEIIGVSRESINLMKILKKSSLFHLSYYQILMRKYARHLM
jgi:peroxiredoxin Q/BCP